MTAVLRIETLLAQVAALETDSEHPLAQAIVRSVRERGIVVSDGVTDFETVPGHGAVAMVGGTRLAIGNARMMEREGAVIDDVQADSDHLSREGKTVTYVAADGRLAGLIALADKPKATVAEAVATFHEMGLKVVMLTGDAQKTAEAVARTLNIDIVIAEVPPDQKVDKVSELQKNGNKVATADVVLMRSDPYDIVKAMALSRKVRGTIKQNLFWAAIYNVVAIPIAGGIRYSSLGILLRPERAALAMAASTITVTINALLLKQAGLPKAQNQMKAPRLAAAPAVALKL